MKIWKNLMGNGDKINASEIVTVNDNKIITLDELSSSYIAQSRTIALYNDSAERDMSGTTYVPEPNLLIPISYSKGDVILINLQGNFWTTSVSGYGYIDIIDGDHSFDWSSNVYFASNAPGELQDSINNTKIFVAKDDGNSTFGMMWRASNSNGTFHCQYRSMYAHIIGSAQV